MGFVFNTIETQPLSGLGGGSSSLDQLRFLEDYVQLNLHTNSESTVVQGKKSCHAVICDSSKEFVLKVEKKNYPRRYSQLIGGAEMEFLNSTGRVIFTCDREESTASVVAGDLALGNITSDSCTARSYRIDSKTGDTVIELKPILAYNGACWASANCCCCNPCCMKLYDFTSNGVAIGAIIKERKGEIGQGHVITFGPDVNVKTKALMLSAALMVNEAYFSSQWCYGNVGIQGRCWLTTYILVAAFMLFLIVTHVIALSSK